MKSMKKKLAFAAAVLALSALPSLAQTRDTTTATQPALKQGSTVNNTAKSNDAAPGTAKELAPDTKQSATGGPSGGAGRGGAAGGN